MKRNRLSSQRVEAAAGLMLVCSVLIAGLYTGCGSDFFGTSPKPRRKVPQTISPPEKETPRLPNTVQDPTPGEGTGKENVTGVKSDAIQLTIVQAPSESWWKNCLLARTQMSNDWTLVACNKDASLGGKTVNLPGLQGQCNIIEMRIETYKNLGDACKPGQPCKGPYPMTPHSDRSPVSDPENFRIYDSSSVGQPDPLIRSNANWQIPDFVRLSEEMTFYRGMSNANQWLRIFFEDQAADRIVGVREGHLSAEGSGIDFNDYVFDIKGENISFVVQSANMTGSGVGCF
jgi:hypothetical protein